MCALLLEPMRQLKLVACVGAQRPCLVSSHKCAAEVAALLRGMTRGHVLPRLAKHALLPCHQLSRR